jgi:hypothetical protein
MHALLAVAETALLIVWALGMVLSLVGIWAALDEGSLIGLAFCIAVASLTWAPVVMAS